MNSSSLQPSQVYTVTMRGCVTIGAILAEYKSQKSEEATISNYVVGQTRYV